MLKRLAISILSAILGIFTAHFFNPFAWVTIIPDGSAYDICTALYFTVFDILLNYVFDWIEKNFFAEIVVIISAPGTVVSVEADPMIELNASGLAELCLNLRLRGKRKHFVENEIIVPAIGMATIQPASRGQGVNLNAEGDNTILLSDIIGHGEYVEIDREFRLAVLMLPSDNIQSECISPRIGNSKWNVRFKCNRAVIRTGR